MYCSWNELGSTSSSNAQVAPCAIHWRGSHVLGYHPCSDLWYDNGNGLAQWGLALATRRSYHPPYITSIYD